MALMEAFKSSSELRSCKGCGQAADLRVGSFCSGACYQRDRRRRRRPHLICASCRRDFVAARKDARWCSDACRFRAYRGRLAIKAEEAERERERARLAQEIARRRADFIASLIG